MPPPPTVRASSICIWLISGLFLFFIITGGVFLILYMVLPETEAPVWFPAAGIILVGIPWAFWFMTCFYRTMKRREPNIDMPPVRAGAAAGNVPATSTTVDNDQPGGSPGSARNVRSGMGTVLGSQEAADKAGTNRKDADVEAAHASPSSIEEGSSLVSHESEMPLTSSMS